MTPKQAIEILAYPPSSDYRYTWQAIHRDLDTPSGSDATMREWAMQRMRDIVAEDANRNNVACTATIAQDVPQVSPACQSGQPPQSDPGADLEAMRADLKWACQFAWKADLTERGVDRLMGIESRWGLI